MVTSTMTPWGTTQLGDEDLFEFENGIWTGKKPPFVECAILRNTNFGKDGTLDYSSVAKIAIEARLLERKRLSPGDIIIERSGGGPTQPVGRVAYFDKQDAEFCFSNFTTRLRVLKPEVVERRFLHLFLLFLHLSGETEGLQRRTTGIRNLDFNEYLKIAIPLPPIGEQRAIVRALETLRTAKEAQQFELALASEYKAALMEYLFTHGTRGEQTKQSTIGDIPNTWKVVELGNLIKDGPQNGLYKPMSSYGTGTPIIRIDDFDNAGRLISSDLRRVRLSPEEVKLFQLQEGDILVNRVNSLSHLGKTLLVTRVVEPTAFESNMMRFTVDASKILAEYVARFLATENSKTYMRGRAKRAVAQSSINQGDVLSIRVPFPSPDEQREIVSILTACDRKCRALEVEMCRVDELFRAMLEELMSGRLTAVPLIEELQTQ